MAASSLDESIQLERELVDAIKKNTRQHTWRILRKIVFSIAIPYLVFLVTWVATNEARAFVAIQYDDNVLNTTSFIASILLVVTATIFTWRWAEKRFGGMALIGRLVSVSKAVLKVERQIDNAKQKAIPSPEDTADIERLAYAAWDEYMQAMHDSGIPIKNSN